MTVIPDDSGFVDDATRWHAVQARDGRADGVFYYSVATTGVYCRPSCAARPARRENVAFHPTAKAAESAGFRPCKRCQPDLPPKAARDAALIARACRAIEAADEKPSLEALAEGAQLSAFHFHRLFRRITGVTPKAYAQAQRAAKVQAGLLAGASVTTAIYDSGFNSSGRFYAAADGMLGMTPSSFRAGGVGEVIWWAMGESTLGAVLVAGTARGICAILLGDSAPALVADLQARFPKADLVAATEGAEWLADVIALVDRPAAGACLPLDIRGTAFQRQVWEALQQIPPGQTRSYAEVAEHIGNPRAVRAVASAIAANKLAVAVPCHRVIGSDGALTGYRWGIARKAVLLAREQS